MLIDCYAELSMSIYFTVLFVLNTRKLEEETKTDQTDAKNLHENKHTFRRRFTHTHIYRDWFVWPWTKFCPQNKKSLYQQQTTTTEKEQKIIIIKSSNCNWWNLKQPEIYFNNIGMLLFSSMLFTTMPNHNLFSYWTKKKNKTKSNNLWNF